MDPTFFRKYSDLIQESDLSPIDLYSQAISIMAETVVGRYRDGYDHPWHGIYNQIDLVAQLFGKDAKQVENDARQKYEELMTAVRNQYRQM